MLAEQRSQPRRGESSGYGIGSSSHGGGVIRCWRCSTKLLTLADRWRAVGYTTWIGVGGKRVHVVDGGEDPAAGQLGEATSFR